MSETTGWRETPDAPGAYWVSGGQGDWIDSVFMKGENLCIDIQGDGLYPEPVSTFPLFKWLRIPPPDEIAAGLILRADALATAASVRDELYAAMEKNEIGGERWRAIDDFMEIFERRIQGL